MDRIQSVRQRAIELAQTGEHIDCLTIELALDREGYPDAYSVCRDDEFRAALKVICDSYWKMEGASGAQRLLDGSEARPETAGGETILLPPTSSN